MSEGIRKQAAQAAARRVYQLFSFLEDETTPYWLAQVKEVVLCAIYESEGRLAEERANDRRILCTGCLALLSLPAGQHGNALAYKRRYRCRHCGRKVRLPKAVCLN